MTSKHCEKTEDLEVSTRTPRPLSQRFDEEESCSSLPEGDNMTTVKGKCSHTNDRIIIAGMLVLYGLLLLTGCSSANYGGLKRSQDVARAFETHHVFEEHRYYYLNQENNPFAVIALQNDYTFKGKNMWRQFDPHSEMLKKIVDLVEGFPVYYSRTYGSYITDSQGKKIGYWYSSLRMTGVTVNNETRTVTIRTETPWLWDDEDGPFHRRRGIRF
jgi:hypothetical protein